jgi:hypothetical protein
MEPTFEELKLANVARRTRHAINAAHLCKDSLPADLVSFIASQLSNVEKLEQIEKQWLVEAETMPVERLNNIIDEMWSGWVRAKLCEIFEQRTLMVRASK